jgi:hypothetical protein
MVEKIRTKWNTLLPYMAQVAAAAQEKTITVPELLKDTRRVLCATGTR